MFAGMTDMALYCALLLFIGVVAWVGHWHERLAVARYMVYGLLAICAGSMIGLGILFSVFHQNILGGLTLSIGICALPAFLPPVRKLLALTIFPGLDVNHPTHLWSVFIYFSALVVTLFSITVLYHPDLIVQEIAKMPLYESAFMNAVMFVLFAFIAIGVGPIVPFQEALDRLGLNKISWKTTGLMVLIALGLAIGIQVIEVYLLTLMDPVSKANIQKIVHALHTGGTPLETLRSAILVGLCAGVGEEIVFRGLMQPLLGLIPTAILFAMIHIHYGPTVLLLELFIVGMLLGWVRIRWNTTAAIVVHSSFDFFAILSSLIHH